MTNIVPLVPIPARLCDLRYVRSGIPGAETTCYLAEPAARRLGLAMYVLEELSTKSCAYGIQIWDAYRNPLTQRTLYEEYSQRLTRQQKGMSIKQAQVEASRYVTSPEVIFPHGTGGAVDLTLTVNGRPARMATDFDDFSPASAADWFVVHPPTTIEEAEIARNHAVLHNAMTMAGFVSYVEEWWHFEWGTSRWSFGTGNKVVLDRVVQRCGPIAELRTAASSRRGS